jgi:hypothetical protein
LLSCCSFAGKLEENAGWENWKVNIGIQIGIGGLREGRIGVLNSALLN